MTGDRDHHTRDDQTHDHDTRDYDMRDYPWWLFTRTAGHVQAGNVTQAHRDLDLALDRMELEHGPELQPRTMRCAAILSHCLRGAYAGGAASEPILVTYMQTLDQMAAAPSWGPVRDIMHTALETFIAAERSHYQGDVDGLVERIRTDIRDMPGATVSLAEYARRHHVSPGYLSRRFHHICGQTFRSERRYFRIKAARELLLTTDLKVRAVALAVGYRDPSRFGSHFHEMMGQTPSQFRTSAQRSRHDSASVGEKM